MGADLAAGVIAGNLEFALNMHEDSVGRQLSALRDTLLDELHSVQQVQDAFLRTCSVSVEEKLSRVLTHHTEFLLEHRNALADLKRQLKTHSAAAGRAASNATDGTKAGVAVGRCKPQSHPPGPTPSLAPA